MKDDDAATTSREIEPRDAQKPTLKTNLLGAKLAEAMLQKAINAVPEKKPKKSR